MRIRAKTDDLASLCGGLAARARASAARARDLRSARCGRFAAAIAESRASADLLASSCARGARRSGLVPGAGSSAFLMERLIFPSSAMLRTRTFTVCPSCT